MDYPQLFNRRTDDSGAAQNSTDTPFPNQTVPNLIPLIKSDNKRSPLSHIDEALAAKLRPSELLRIKAMDYTVDFLLGRTIVDPDQIEKIFDKFYNKINGRKKKLPQQNIR